MKHNVQILSVLIAVSILASLPLALACGSSPGRAASAEVEAPSRQRAVYSVTGNITESCPAVVKAALSELPGVEGVEASYEEASATVTFDPAQTDSDTIAEAIRSATGFTVQLVELLDVPVQQSPARFARHGTCSVGQLG